MSKQIIDCGFGVIETRETFYTEETISKLNQQIAELQKQLEEKEKIIQMQQNIERYDIGEMLTENTKLKQRLKSQPAEIIDEIKKQMETRKLEYISHLTKKHCYGLRIDRIFEILDTILKEYQK